MRDVCVEIGAINKYVIEEHCDIFSQKRPECVIHGRLECRRHVTESKRHDSELIMAQMSSKSRFMNIFVGHADLMKSLTQIELGEARRLPQIVQKFIDCRHGETVLDRDSIQGAIVHTTPP